MIRDESEVRCMFRVGWGRRSAKSGVRNELETQLFK